MKSFISKLIIILVLLYTNISVYAQGATPCGNNHKRGRDPEPNTCKKAGDPFDPYTGNEHREVKDLEIWGGVGEMPLVWTRYGNSRVGNFKLTFGAAHYWNHNFQYSMYDAGLSSQHQKEVVIHFPEGGSNVFAESKRNPGLWLSTPGIDNRLFQEGSNFYLQKPNGFRYRFEKLIDNSGGVYYQLQDFRDSYQNLYVLTYDSPQYLKRVTEPGGRYFDIIYDTINLVKVIKKVITNDGRSVEYNYDIFKDSITSWVRLIQVNYGDSTHAIYTYSQREAGSRPRLEHAIDPRYSGADVNMIFIYNDSADISGFIKEERNGVSGELMTTLNAETETRIVCYANGRVQKFYQPTSQHGNINTYTDGLGRMTQYFYNTNGLGFLKKRIDELGRETIYDSVTKYNNPLVIIYPDKSKEKWTRDNLDLVLMHTDELGRVTAYTRDSLHRITRIDYPDNTFETFKYNDFGQVIYHTRRNKGEEFSFYNITGLLEKFTDAEGNITQYTYDKASRLASITDALNHTIKYTYNERGLLIKMFNADKSFQTYAYDTFGNRTLIKDELKHSWTTEYDEFKRPEKMTDPIRRTTKYEYDLPGGVCGCQHDNNTPTKIILPSGKTTTIEYDVEWEKTSETVGAGSADAATTFYEYDLVGNLVTVIDPNKTNSVTEYDARNRRVSSTDPLGNKTQWGYDKTGNIVNVIRPDTGTTVNVFDQMNRLTKTIDPKGQVTKMKYDAEGNMVTLTDPKNHDYDFNYDLLNRRTKMIYPDGSFEKYSYDKVSNLKSYTNRGGAIRTYNYDSRNREILSSWNDGTTPSINSNYDIASRLIELSSSVSRLSYQYDEANELTKVTQAVAGGRGSKVVKYQYNKDGLRNKMVYPDGSVIDYKYTDRNQLKSIFAGDTIPVTAYTYDLNGNHLIKTLENGTATLFAYDDANRILTVDHQKGGASFARFDYGYDKVNRRTFIQRDGGKGDAYNYDAIDQVTKVFYDVTDPGGAASSPTRKVNYDWDPAGNRDAVTDNGTTTNYTTNNLNEYTRVNSDGLNYNKKGDLTNFNGWTYNYDAQDRLIKATKGSTTVSFAYDPWDRCVKRTLNERATLFYWDGWNLIIERNESDAEIARYVHGANVDEILKKVSEANNINIYYHQDALGSVVRLTNKNGNVTEQYSYDVFGKPTIRNANGENISTSAFDNRFKYTGREYIETVGLYDFRSRIYSHSLGRFIQKDELDFYSGDYNLYRYVNNNTVNKKDPWGLISYDIGNVNRVDQVTFDLRPPSIPALPVLPGDPDINTDFDAPDCKEDCIKYWQDKKNQAMRAMKIAQAIGVGAWAAAGSQIGGGDASKSSSGKIIQRTTGAAAGGGFAMKSQEAIEKVKAFYDEKIGDCNKLCSCKK